MKKILQLILLLIVGITLRAQTINDTPIKDIDVEYVHLIGFEKKLGSSKWEIKIDFGQKFTGTLTKSSKETVVKDEKGEIVEFNSIIDALNFMSKNGFDFVDAYAIPGSSLDEHYYLLKNRRYRAK